MRERQTVQTRKALSGELHRATEALGVISTMAPDSAAPRQPLYTPEERKRRDASIWTQVQGVLAPVQFFVFLISLGLVIRALITGTGFAAADTSVVIKTFTLYTIMITGSVWEKVVFGKWLFARPFFWEDVFSMLVLALHTLYLWMTFSGGYSQTAMLWVALAAYAAYVVNATQFILKLRAARLEDPDRLPSQTAGAAA
jgi:3-vinyl bacteriochlorophyllide hydratase